MPTYTITRLFDVRAWRKVEMDFPNDEAAAAHVEKLAQEEREGYGPPPDHPLEDASNYTDFDEGGRVSYFLDKDRDAGGYADEVCSRDAYTAQELAQEYGPQMLAALRLALPVCENAYYDALTAQDNVSGGLEGLEREREQSTAAALAAWQAVHAAIAKAEGREPEPLELSEADTPDATDAEDENPFHPESPEGRAWERGEGREG